MKIEKKKKKKKTRIVLFSWLPTLGTYYNNLAVWIFFKNKIWQIQAIFSIKKNPVSHIFQVKIWLPFQVRFGINWQHDFRTSLKFHPLSWLALYINSQK